MAWSPVLYDAEGLRRFLWLVEEALDERARKGDGRSRAVRVVLIGGGAIALGYGARHGTTDVDAWEASEALKPAWRAAARRAGGDAPALHAVHVADPPYHFEDRLRAVEIERTGADGREEKMRRLRLFVPERHDLAMMKAVRGEDRDVEAIAALHAVHPLDPARLEHLYRTEMSHIVSDMKAFRTRFLNLFATLFGEKAARTIEKKLPVLGTRPKKGTRA